MSIRNEGVDRGGFGAAGRFFLAVLLLSLVLQGCATAESRKDLSEEEALRDRVSSYWGHKIRGEFDKSYEYEDPFFRKSTTLVNYIKSFKTGRTSWTGAQIVTMTIQGDTAAVDMKIRVKLVSKGSGIAEPESPLRENWVKIDDVWYHVPKKSKGR